MNVPCASKAAMGRSETTSSSCLAISVGYSTLVRGLDVSGVRPQLVMILQMITQIQARVTEISTTWTSLATPGSTEISWSLVCRRENSWWLIECRFELQFSGFWSISKTTDLSSIQYRLTNFLNAGRIETSSSYSIAGKEISSLSTTGKLCKIATILHFISSLI